MAICTSRSPSPSAKGKVVSQRPPQVSGFVTAQPFLTLCHSVELIIHSLGDPLLLPTVCFGMSSLDLSIPEKREDPQPKNERPCRQSMCDLSRLRSLFWNDHLYDFHFHIRFTSLMNIRTSIADRSNQVLRSPIEPRSMLYGPVHTSHLSPTSG